MSESLDDLTSLLQEKFQVDPNALGEHPRYSQFKNLTKAAEQQAKRRQDALNRQKEGRFEKMIRLRNLALDEPISDEEEIEEDGSSVAGSSEAGSAGNAYNEAMDFSGTKKKRKSKYAEKLMLSEWLVDIPETLSEEWVMVASPIGKRCLVVASKGTTTCYNKNGRVVSQFQSKLPGGCGKGKTSFTVLDCILHERTYYVIDILCWNEREYADSPFDFRMFMLKSKMEETPELRTTTRNCKYKFVQAPSCRCNNEEIKEMMKEPFEFPLDGLLFYHNSVVYEAGQSPLVGWLKPWMLPEILNVPVHESFKTQGSTYESSQQFIDAFNLEHGHNSKICRDENMDA